MSIFSVLNNIFLAVYIPAVAITLARLLSVSVKQTENTPSKNNNFVESMTAVQTIYYILPCILFVGAIVYVAFKYNHHWILAAIGVPQLLSILDTTYWSAEVVSSIVKSTGNQKLSRNEGLAVQILALIFAAFCNSGIHDLLETKLKEISSIAARDGLMIVLIFIFLFCYIFFIVSLIPIPISFVVSFIKKTPKGVIGRASKFAAFFTSRTDGPYRTIPLFLFSALQAYSKLRIWLRILAYLTIPVIICADFLISFISLVFSFLCVGLGHFFLLLKRMGGTVSRFVVWSNKIQSKRYTSVSFRIALVIALAGTVVINRYYHVLENFESNSAILEFVASTILIPVIFEWINSAKKSKDE